MDKFFGVNFIILFLVILLFYVEYCKVIIDSGIKFVEIVGYNLCEYVEDFKVNGIKVIYKCMVVCYVLFVECMGVDVIFIDGFECVGYFGEDDILGLILILAAVNKVKIFMLVFGGFGDG